MALSYDNITEKYYEGETMQQNQWIVDEMNQVYKQGIRVDVNGLSYNACIGKWFLYARL